MPEGSAAASRGVAQSRVGKQLRRPWEDRAAAALSLHRVVLRGLPLGDSSAATVRFNK